NPGLPTAREAPSPATSWLPMSTRDTLGASYLGGRETALDEQAIRAFLATEYPRVVAAISLACGSRAAAEDAVQEALARAWERGEHIETLRAWVMKVAINLVRSGFRRMLAERRARERMANRAVEFGSSLPTMGDAEDA